MASPIGPEAVYSFVSVADPSLSPDGRLLAFTRSWIDREEMEGRSRIMVMALPNGHPEEFTQGVRDSAPKFSPDGRHLAFLRPDDKQQRQVWVIAVHGGEARKLTDVAGGVGEFAWSPDGQRLAFVADVDPDRPPEGHDPKKDPRVKVVRRIRYRYDTMGWRGDAHRHIFVTSLQGGPARQITAGDWDDLSPVWSPDGTRIAFISGRRDERDIRTYSEAYVVAADGGTPERWSGDLYSIGAVGWSPDGTRLAVVASDDPNGSVGWQGWLYVLAPGMEPQRLTDDSIRPATGGPPLTPAVEVRWSKDDRILFIADAQGQSYLWEVAAAGGKGRAVAGGGLMASALALDGEARTAVLAGTPPGSPSELYLVNPENGSTQQLTNYNREYLSQHPPAQIEKFSFERKGLTIECRLWLPPDFDPARRYPLVLDIHGGPNGAFYDAFNMNVQALATAGYVVLTVNPRGSATYGRDFTMAVLGDWGGEDYQELMAAVDMVAARPYIDSSRLGVHGYSYGGFMTSWIVGHTDRFQAAVVGAPCIDLPSMYGTSDIGVSFGEPQWGGTRKDALSRFAERSPLTYAHNVNTPVLLLHGEADLRCPIEQSEQYFVALKRLGKEVEFVRFPDCAHSFLRNGHPRMREEYVRRLVEWFGRYLKAEARATAKAAAGETR